MDATPTRPITIILALAMVAGLFPLGTAGAGHAACDLYDHQINEHITMSNPLSGRIGANELVHLVVNEETNEPINGLDGYVVDVGCKGTADAGFQLRVEDAAGPYELGLKFYNEEVQKVGQIDLGVDEEVTERKPMPDATKYVVVYMEQGPLVTGVTGEHPTVIYSLEFEFEALN